MNGTHQPSVMWFPMSVAPRQEGALIEVRCNLAAEAWYGLYHWSNQIMVDGRTVSVSWGWRGAAPGMTTSTVGDYPGYMWRPYDGKPEEYQTPNGGPGRFKIDIPDDPPPPARKPRAFIGVGGVLLIVVFAVGVLWALTR
jgi:hypothetical protein